MDSYNRKHRQILQDIARRVLLERGLLPDFSPEIMREVEQIKSAPTNQDGLPTRDLRDLCWCSIDNDDSEDLDQLTVAEALSDGKTRILVAIADVDVLVAKGSAVDGHARHNTTSIYTAAQIFPMLPEKLSTDLTSLDPGVDRLAIVIEMIVAEDGSLQDAGISSALVHNHAKLAYNGVGAWLTDNGPMPAGIAEVQGLAENLRLQDSVAQRLKNFRHLNGALTLETVEAKPVFDQDDLRDLQVRPKNRATEIIEDFMVSANGVTARFLASRNFPSLRRVVRTPRRWDRIVAIAADRKYELPDEPNPKALQEFLVKEQAEDPLRFPDVSLSVIKLLGSGEYVAEFPGDSPQGHFGLAVRTTPIPPPPTGAIPT